MLKDLQNILDEIPEGEDSNYLNKYFVLFFDIMTNSAYSNAELLQFLFELSEKQWHAYELLNEKFLLRIKEYLMSEIDLENEDKIRVILSIASCLGVPSIYENIKRKEDEMSKGVQDVLKEFEPWNGGDPYMSLRNL